MSRVAVLLEALAAGEPSGGSTSELASLTGVARPTVHRLLTALAGRGLAERHADGRWVLGPEIFLWGCAASRRYDHTSQARPLVRWLAQETGESAFYSVRRGDETVCMVREDGSFPLRSHVLYEGRRFPLGVASAGTAILAYLSATDIDRCLTRTDRSDFGSAHEDGAVRARLAMTREIGWALNPGLVVHGSWGMGAAVFDEHGAPIGALSLTGVEHRFAPERQPDLGRRLLSAAHELSGRLRGR